MKKLYIILALVVVSFMMVFAADTIKILRIYHNGTFTAIPLANVDSVEHSRYDANGKLQEDYTSSIIETLDSTYNIPICEVDSVVVTEAEIEDYWKNVDNILNYIDAHEEQNYPKFQTELMEWLNSQDWVSNVDITNNFVTVVFKNGFAFFIDFQIINNNMSNRASLLKETKKENIYFYVSSMEKEEIINELGVLYIQGRKMFLSNADEEYKRLHSERDNSPVELYIKPIIKNRSFLDLNYSNYGLVLISQTHGVSNVYGSFEVELGRNQDGRDGKGVRSVNHNGLVIEVFDAGKISHYYVTRIDPSHMSEVIGSNSPIIYGNYCWSWGLANKLNRCTIFGHGTESAYENNYENITKFSFNLFNGLTFEESIQEIIKPYSFDVLIWPFAFETECIPLTNKPNSKQRFFSIFTDGITNNDEIKGKIKGYRNLKSGIKWMLYAHEGTGKFTPGDDNVKKFEDAYKPMSDGSFTVSSKIVNKYPDHSLMVGFEYAGKVYYGEQMYFEGLHIKIDNIISDNHEFVIKGRLDNINDYDKRDYHCNIIEREGLDAITIDNFEDRKNARYKYISIGEDGSIEYRISMDYYKRKTTYGFVIAVEYNGNWFFSDTKYCSWDWCPDGKHPHMIDLGLTSGTKWACCNIGSNKPEDYGIYFAWGEITARTSDFTKWEYEHFDEENVKIIDIGDNIAGTKYDAASTNWGSTWRMPTKEQFEELFKECKYDLLTVNNVNGLRLKGKNGNIIFIPYSGNMVGEGDAVSHPGMIGDYWSSTSGSLESAYELFMYNILVEIQGEPKVNGLTIRPVGK